MVYLCNIYDWLARYEENYIRNSKKDQIRLARGELQPLFWSLHSWSLWSDVNGLSGLPAGKDVAALAQSPSSSDVYLMSDPERWHPTGWAGGRGSILS